MRGWLWVLVALLAFAPAARAQMKLTYVTFPNGGTAGPRNDRNLPTFTINVTSANLADFPANFLLLRQDSSPITTTIVINANSGNVQTGNAPNALFEGRTQILGQAQAQNNGDVSNVPATYPTSLPIFVDVNTGPPNNPTLQVTSASGNVTRINPFFELVTFNRANIGQPFDVRISGNVQNVPTAVPPPGVAPPPAGEVQARVDALLSATQFAGGVTAPLAKGLSGFTEPNTVTFAFPVVANPAAPGNFTLPPQDFSGQVSGIYEYRLRATDITGAVSPVTTASIVRVNVDLVAPAVTVTFPNTRTLIIDGPNPPPGVTGDRWTLSGVISDERRQGTTVTIDVIDTSVATLQETTVASQAGPIGTFALPLDFTPGGVIIPTSSPQDIRRIDIQARDLAGNPSAVEHVYVVRDQAPPPVPVITLPTPGQGTSAQVQPFRGTINNVLPGLETQEEQGIVRIRLTITSRVNPAINTTVETVSTPVSATHDSALDNAPGFSIPPNVLGNIPDGFTFNIGVNLRNFPFGPADVVARAVDGVGNVSGPSAPVTFIVGPSGPALKIDFANSGPDDNYQFIGLRTNQRGADDADPDGVKGFFVSLKSPERLDVGVPPSSPRPPFFAGGTDPGNPNTLIISGSASDVQTPVALITASGPGVPTTSFAPAPNTTVTFSLPVDIRGLPEGVPTQINLQATNSDGTSGLSTSVVVFRDVVPARKPRITFPPLLTCLFGSGTIPCFFAGNTNQVVEGVAEPNALVVLSTPPTTGTISPPIPRTSNTLVPNPSSALSSLPRGFQSARADAQGLFRFNSVNFSTVATSITTPVPVIFQAIDSFDNTDPVSSAITVGVFRLDQSGEVVRVRLDPRQRNFQVFPGTPPSPVLQQFFGRERIQIEVTYSTVITQAPLLTVKQTGTVPAAARLISPAGPGAITTQVLVYDYVAPAVDALFDGPATISITGGKDVFGFIPNAFNLSRAFFVDSVAPVLAVTGPAAFFPKTGQAVGSIGLVSVAVEDRPSSNGSTEASCVSTLFTRIRLLGPLETNPTQEIPLTEPAPPANSQAVLQPCGPVTVTRVPVAPPTQEGTYEYRAEIGDNVGNVAKFSSTFVLDRSPITTALIRCNPADGSFVTTLPRFGNQQAVFVTVSDLNVDLQRSSARLFDPSGASIGQTSIGTGTNVIVVPLTAPLPGNGRSDGPYRIAATIFDRAGNPSVPNTCTFILDTLPPQIFGQFPANFGCAGPPTRFVQATVVDTVPPNVPLPLNSGVDLARTDIKLRLLVPDPLNKTLAGTEIKGIKRYRTVTAPPAIVALEFVDALGHVRALADDGREDGRYRVEVTAADRAGNTTTTFGFFDHDAQPPQVTLTNFPEGSFLADTLLVINGTVFDDGPCGLLQGATASTLSTRTVQVSVRKVDDKGRDVVPVVAPFFDFTNVTSIARKASPAPFVKDEADWAFVAPIPASPGRARLEVRAIDRAGNIRTITREITINGGPLAAPVTKFPTNGQVTADKTVVFEWAPVTQARQYQLELTRVSPTPLTTRTTFPVEFPFNEQFPPTANGIRKPVDLVEFASTVAGGSPITTASVFSWRMRSLDVSLNPGPFSAPTTFVVDPTPPGVGRVRFGLSTADPPVVGAGTTQVTIFFAEDAGMDPKVPIDVTLQPRDTNIPPIRLTQTGYAPLRWDGTITLPVPGELRDINGRATLLIRGAKNLAGRPLEDVRLPVDINMGPFFQVRFFSNPAIPEELILVIKATASSASTTGIALGAPPTIQATQHGHIVSAVMPVNVIAGTPVANSTFRSFIRIDPRLIGFLDFTITGTDVAGAQASRTFGVAVAGALALGGVRFPLVLAQASASLAQGALPSGGALLGVSSEQAPAGVLDAALARAHELGLTPAGEIGYVFPDMRELSAPLNVTVPLSALKLPPGVKPSQVGLYRVGPNASTDFEWIGVPGQPGQLAGSTKRLGYLGAFVDTEPPVVGAIEPAPNAEVTDSRMAVRAHFTDRASGIAPDAVTVMVDGQTYPAHWDATTGDATWQPDHPLPVGQHEIQVAARDRAGNEVRSARFHMAVLGPLAIQQAVAVPNPIRAPPARIRYMLTKPADRVRLRLYDTAGRQIQSLEGTGFTGANTIDWDLDTRRGRGVANGVYLFTMEAADGERTAKARGKIAVMR